MTNPAELMKIHNSVNLVKNDSDVTIRKMTIEGYASPEGTYAHNLMLSEKRTEALKNYLGTANIARGIRIEASGKGENWAGFMKYLKENPGIPQYSRLLSIANSDLAPDQKEKMMRKGLKVGRAKGRAEGESRLSRLISLLLKSGKTDEAMAATESEEIRKQLYAKYGIA